jgi:hypothetical protein
MGLVPYLSHVNGQSASLASNLYNFDSQRRGVGKMITLNSHFVQL